MRRPVLKRYLYANSVTKDHRLILGTENGFSHEIALPDPRARHLLKLLDGNRTRTQLIKEMEIRFGPKCAPSINGYLKTLKANGLLDDDSIRYSALSNAEVERYRRQLHFFALFSHSPNEKVTFQKRLKESKVLLVGLGGIGSYALFGCAGMGIGTIRCIDSDTIESSNLNRQILYSEKDIGRSKITVARERIMAMNSLVRYEFVDRKITSEKDLEHYAKGMDFVLLSADTPRGVILLWAMQAASRLGIPCSQTGYSESFGYVGPLFIPGKTACSFCGRRALHHAGQTSSYVRAINSRYCPPSFGPVNAFLTSYQLLEMTKYLTGFSKPSTLNRRYVIDFDRMRSRFDRVPHDPICRVCSKGGDENDNRKA